MTIEELLQSASRDGAPPQTLTEAGQVLWHIKADNWDTAHEIAQDMHTPLGSWLHALLHLIEGDTGNAGYWFRQAGQRARSVSEVDALWSEIADSVFSDNAS